jgi:hypothetical protein
MERRADTGVRPYGESAIRWLALLMELSTTPAPAPFGARFLHHPDLFPGRRAGDVWGAEAVEIDFVGGPYRFADLSAAQAEALAERFGPLCRPVGNAGLAGIETRLLRLDAGELRRLDLTGWTYTFDREYHPDHVRLAGYDFVGRIELAPLAGALFTAEDGGLAFQCLAENFFRVVVAYRLLALGGVLLHSSGVVSQGLAHLFLGPSGAGKSTIARLSMARGRDILSDDMNALCPAGDGVIAEKLPFAGDFGRTVTPRRSYPLASLQRLRHAAPGGAPLRTPLRPAQAMALLLACAPFVNADPHRLDALSQNLEGLVARFAAHELTFGLEEDFWPLLEPAAVEDSP